MGRGQEKPDVYRLLIGYVAWVYYPDFDFDSDFDFEEEVSAPKKQPVSLTIDSKGEAWESGAHSP